MSRFVQIIVYDYDCIDEWSGEKLAPQARDILINVENIIKIENFIDIHTVTMVNGEEFDVTSVEATELAK